MEKISPDEEPEKTDKNKRRATGKNDDAGSEKPDEKNEELSTKVK